MKRILIVDDEPAILEVIQMMLEDAGYKVQTTEKGEYAENLKNGNKLPDLILLDILLRGKDGREIAKKLKNKQETKHIPIILISAHVSAGHATKECGADDFIAKPFDMNDLLRTVAKYTS